MFVLGEIVGWEFLLVIAVIALLFGSSKVPQLARSLGQAKREFEHGLDDGHSAAATDPAQGTNAGATTDTSTATGTNAPPDTSTVPDTTPTTDTPAPPDQS